jgi:hypothetical protein
VRGHHQRAARHCLGHFDLALELVDRQQFVPTACTEAAVLRENLVLHNDGRHTGCHIARHGVGDVHRIAETRVNIGNDRAILHLADRAHHFQMRTHWQNIGIRYRIGCRKLEAASPYRVKARGGGELSRQRVMCGHCERRLMNVQLGMQRGGLWVVLRHDAFLSCKYPLARSSTGFERCLLFQYGDRFPKEKRKSRTCAQTVENGPKSRLPYCSNLVGIRAMAATPSAVGTGFECSPFSHELDSNPRCGNHAQ